MLFVFTEPGHVDAINTCSGRVLFHELKFERDRPVISLIPTLSAVTQNG